TEAGRVRSTANEKAVLSKIAGGETAEASAVEATDAALVESEASLAQDDSYGREHLTRRLDFEWRRGVIGRWIARPTRSAWRDCRSRSRGRNSQGYSLGSLRKRSNP